MIDIEKKAKTSVRGRPPIGDVAMRSYNITLDVETAEAARALGVELGADPRRAISSGVREIFKRAEK